MIGPPGYGDLTDNSISSQHMSLVNGGEGGPDTSTRYQYHPQLLAWTGDGTENVLLTGKKKKFPLG